MHFPSDRDINYFAQLIAERSVTKIANGQKFRVWELPPGRANEALDIRVYGYAALCGLMHMGLKLNRRVEAVETDEAETLPPPAPIVEQLDVVKPKGPFVKQEKPAKKSFASRLA
jgi:phage terminase large subunit GpA-like protein